MAERYGLEVSAECLTVVRPFQPSSCRLRRLVLSTLANGDGTLLVSASDRLLLGLFDVHHVVAGGLDRAAPARALLEAWSVEVDSTANAAVLPRWFHQRRGLHRSSYLEGVNRRLVTADGIARRVRLRAGAIEGRRIFVDVLRRMGDTLCFETADAGAASLQVALRRCDVTYPSES